MKLLIAEDDLTSRTVLAGVTRQWGYEAIAVEDGEAAWQILQSDDAPRLLLLDWEMPKLDGPSLCARLRAKESDDPPFIILLTSRSETIDIVEGLGKGANDYIAKPFDNAELQARLKVGQRMLDLQAELAQAREALSIQANHDVLTGLMNRGAVMASLENEVARAHIKRQNFTISIGLCDIDFFKKVNDTFGHSAGDAVLKEVAQRMAATLRPYDHIGRYGGEEFLAVLHTDSNEVLTPFERIRRAVADKPFALEQGPLSITLSCGVATLAPTTVVRDCKALVDAADIALYQAKRAGRNCVLLAEDDS